MRTQLLKDFLKCFILLCFGFLESHTFGQTKRSIDMSLKEQIVEQTPEYIIRAKEAEWVSPQEGVTRELYVLEIQNLTNKKIMIQWENILVYGSTCYNCSSENHELKFQIEINPMQTITSTQLERNKNLEIFRGYKNIPSSQPLTSLQLANIKLL